MDKQTAEQLARKYLCENIKLEIYHKIPPEIYTKDPENEILIAFSLFEEPQFGPSKYVTVSKTDGTVRFIGHYGE